MLDDRARTLLKTLVERYIADGTPVGSRTLSRTSGLDLSPATMAPTIDRVLPVRPSAAWRSLAARRSAPPSAPP